MSKTPIKDLIRIREWQLANPERRKAACARYNATKKAKQADARYRKTRKHKRIQERYNNTLDGALRRAMRDRLRKALKKKYRSGSAIADLGCSIEFFKGYIAAQFRTGMSWENWGQWHLDHILPICAFDLADREQFLVAFHYTNYQPLWAAENLKKGGRV